MYVYIINWTCTTVLVPCMSRCTSVLSGNMYAVSMLRRCVCVCMCAEFKCMIHARISMPWVNHCRCLGNEARESITWLFNRHARGSWNAVLCLPTERPRLQEHVVAWFQRSCACDDCQDPRLRDGGLGRSLHMGVLYDLLRTRPSDYVRRRACNAVRGRRIRWLCRAAEMSSSTFH